METTKLRKSIDCRDFPGTNCTLKISGTEEEVLKAASMHGMSAHGYQDTPQFHEELRSHLKDEQDYRTQTQEPGTQVA